VTLDPRLSTALSDRYRLERELGEGGMATVYLAEDLKHHRKVAVKVLRPEIAGTLGPERFAREIEVAARLQHPHILGLLDSGNSDGFFYYVMPYVEGESLRQRIQREGALPVAEAVRILRDVTDALAAAHAQGVVHRDIKPENVLLSGRHAMVADFGVAKAVSEASGRHQITTAGVALGTPAYMAPEQAAADPHVDHRADLYAVGIMGYELLTGQPPFVAATPQAVLAAQVTQAPVPITVHRPSVPAELSAAIMRCLEKRAPDRWQSAGELVTELERFVTSSGGQTPTDTRPATAVSRPVTRRKGLLAGLGVVAVAGGLAWFVLHARPTGSAHLERLALLPLANRTGDTTRQILAEGLTREIISALTRARVRITGFASVARYAGKDTPLPQVAKELNGVNAIAVGSLVRAGGGGATLALELLDPATGDNLWAATYEVGPSEVASLANRAAGDIAAAIQAPVTREQAAELATRPRVNAEAYSEYLLGRHLAERFTPGDARHSIEHLERAVALDSTFAPAYAALGYVYASSAGWYGWIQDSMAYPRAERDIQRAFTLDARLGLAYLARATLRWFRDWDWPGAESDFQRAIELEPGSWVYEVYAGYLQRVGRMADAVTAAGHAVEADPSSPTMHSDFANILLGAGLAGGAEHEAQLALALDSNYAEVYRNLAWIHLLAGRPDTALSLLNRYEAMSGVTRPDVRGWIYVALGRRAEAGRLADSVYRVDPTGGWTTEWAAVVLAQLGRKDEAFRALDAVNRRRTHWYFAGPSWDPLRSDPRFAELIRRSGLDPTIQYPPGSTRQ
jgi:serine/threonine-protein kinase